MQFKKEAENLYSKLEEGEKGAYYKKRRVYPILNKDGSINWFNFLTGGTWMKLAIIIAITLITLGLIFEYTSNLKLGAECIFRENLLKNLTTKINNIPFN